MSNSVTKSSIVIKGKPASKVSLTDTTAFLGTFLPDEIRVASKVFPNYENSESHLLPKLSKIALDSILSNNINFSIELKELANLELKAGDFNVMITAIFTVTQIAIKNKIRLSQVQIDCTTIQLPSLVLDSIVSFLKENRFQLESVVQEQRIRFPTLTKLKWRIDVTISSGLLSRVMRPNILFQMILSDGSIKTFEVSIEQFNQLRYSVAKVLNDIQTLERHPMMRIINEFKRREEDDYNY
eukprot:gene15097-20314_t